MREAAAEEGERGRRRRRWGSEHGIEAICVFRRPVHHASRATPTAEAAAAAPATSALASRSQEYGDRRAG